MLKPKYYLSKDNEFVIENYNSAPTFASFLPGIAGQFGCPMWVFYCNRGQAISSCGVLDKDNALMEFEPANKAYGQTPITSFRTFIKIAGQFFEPFKNSGTMFISPDSKKLVDENTTRTLIFASANEQIPNKVPDETIKFLDGSIAFWVYRI